MAAADHDRESLAAEFALGTLGVDERREAEALLGSDEAFVSAVAGWNQRLAVLAFNLTPVPVSDRLKAKVMAAIAPAQGANANDNVPLLRRRLAQWRGIGIAASAIAAGLAGVLLFRAPVLPEGGRYVAVLQSDGPGPAFVASVDLVKGTVSVRTVSAAPPAGKSYELWAIGAGRAKPQSLGVIDASYRIPTERLGRIDASSLKDTLFAVTIEQQGGSPTGDPSGPPVFSGKLIPTE